MTSRSDLLSAVADTAARAMQRLLTRASERRRAAMAAMYPEFPAVSRSVLQVPTTVGPATVTVYRPAVPLLSSHPALPPVHVNLHGGGYILPLVDDDDPLCRFLAANAGVVVLNVDYVVAPQHRFPAAPRQAYEVALWAAREGAAHGWDGARLTVGGQSAGGALAAAVARQAWEEGGPAIALQVLHYPPLDLATPAAQKVARAANPVLKPWMANVFDTAYVPDKRQRLDRLVSPANPHDTTDLTGLAPALLLLPDLDLLRDEGHRYAERLRAVGALYGVNALPNRDHGYDLTNPEAARDVYTQIAAAIRSVHGAPRGEG